ncbi:heat shock protein 70 family protein [Kipferlia bialata]|uniref:Heat shock protein 70 family protein n=1 Tax=Kipferlia bialata TaxID=797122 RepID=A0A9K3D3F9_9EUKA|nr:heat shock protein 70 family protein [Kipferlia bialata]|eukprot:g10147.t1
MPLPPPSLSSPTQDSDRLLFVLEPEAAAVYGSTKVDEFQLSTDDRFMVVDLGGGTADITVHTVKNDSGQLAEVTRGHGDACGAVFVDYEFMDLVREKLGHRTMEEAESKCPMAVSALMNSWEVIKRQHQGPEDDTAFVRIPTRMQRLIPSAVIEAMEDADGYDDQLCLSGPTMSSLFDPVIDRVLKCVDLVMDRTDTSCTGIATMLVVGGFSQSPYLMRRLREEYQEQRGMDIKIISPDGPGAAVVAGAVLYGMRPSQIASRIARYSYGIGCRSRYIESNPRHKAHSADVFTNNAGVALLKKGFLKNTTLSSSLPADHIATSHVVFPDDSLSVGVRIYYSTERDPLFTTLPTVYPLGDTVTVRRPSLEVSDKIKITFAFGDTEIHMRVIPEHDETQARDLKVHFTD